MMRSLPLKPFVLLACAGALSACNEHPLTPLGDTLVSVEIETSPRLGSNGVDILWVVDDSPSMREEQVELGQRFDEFIAALADLQADFHMAVITTDRNDGGLFQTEPGPVQSAQCVSIPAELEYCEDMRLDQAFLSGDDYLTVPGDPSQGFVTEALAADFRCIASAGDCGGAFERGLEVLELSLSDDLGPANAGFLRDDAFLVVIFLTDEDDCSNADAFNITRDDDCYALETREQLTPVQNFYDRLVELKGGDDSRVLIAGLIGPDDNQPLQTYDELAQNGPRFSCISELAGQGGSSANARDGERYRELIDLVGSRGVEESICQGNFSNALTNIGDILRENLDVNCLREEPVTCESDADCRGTATCLQPGDPALGDRFCSNFEISVEIQPPEGGAFHELISPGQLGEEPNPEAQFQIDFESQACLHGVSFSFAPGARPRTGSRYRVTYPRAIEIIESE